MLKRLYISLVLTNIILNRQLSSCSCRSKIYSGSHNKNEKYMYTVCTTKEKSVIILSNVQLATKTKVINVKIMHRLKSL